MIFVLFNFEFDIDGLRVEMKKTKFLFCLFDGLRRDFVQSNIMPNLNEFRNEWVDYPNSSSTFPSETRVQVSSFVTGTYCGGSISGASKEGSFGHGIMANSFYDPILGFDGPLDTSDMAKMEEAKGIYGSLQKTPSLGELLAKENKNYSVITTGKIGNARLLNLNADDLQQRLFSIWGADISSELADYDGIIEKFGKVPKQSFPNNKVSQYATQILLEHFLLDRSVDVQVIWYNEPDLSFHYEGIGSKASLSSLECLDQCFGKIMKWWNAEGRSDGWNVIVCSDHAQISKQKQVSVIDELKCAGFKAGVSIIDDIDVAVKASYSGQITVRDRDQKLVKKIIEFLQAQDLLKKSDMDSKATPGNGGFFSCFFSRPVDGKKIKKPLAKPNVPLTDTAVQTQQTGKEGDGEPEKEDRGSQLGDESADEDDVIGDISYGLTYTLATESLRDKTVFILGRK